MLAAGWAEDAGDLGDGFAAGFDVGHGGAEVLKDQLRRRMYQPVPVQGRWLASVVRGHMAYYAVHGNARAVRAFRDQVTRHWHKALRRRSQKTRINWTRMHRIATRWLPPAREMHPFPEARFAATHPR